MTHDRLHNVNIVSADPLPTPDEIRGRLPLPAGAEEAIYGFRAQVRAILDRKAPRRFVVVGPCSIHDIGSALRYAERLGELSERVGDRLMLIMRVYFEKPRTTVGWKGFINDPQLDDSFRVDEGLYRAREFLLKLVAMGLPAATEALDPITPQYIGDLITWTAIGARTTESQTHRELASGLSTPVGFKNGTDGSITVAINALESVSEPHHFLGLTQTGDCAVFHTSGNGYGHIVLRGGPEPNYDAASVHSCEASLAAAGLPLNIMVDCSHANSQRQPERQVVVLDDCVGQIEAGNQSLVGFMVESHLVAGKQSLSEKGIAGLLPDVSVTDACMDWQTTEKMILDAHGRLGQASRRVVIG